MSSRFLATARSGGTIELAHPAHDRVDLVHAADVSRAVVAMVEGEAWETFNISSGHAVSIWELAEACVLVAGQGSVRIKDDGPVTDAVATRFSLDTRRATRRLGWEPVVDLRRGLSMMMDESMYVSS